MNLMYRAFFKRDPDTFRGVFSLVKYTVDPTKPEFILKQVPARSGQRAYANTDSIIGKSPIPYGDWVLHADKEEQKNQKPGARGIGWAFHVSSSEDNFLTLAYKKITRSAIMLHAENGFPGSAGCIVLVNWSDMVKAGKELEMIAQANKGNSRACKIRLTVFE